MAIKFKRIEFMTHNTGHHFKSCSTCKWWKGIDCLNEEVINFWMNCDRLVERYGYPVRGLKPHPCIENNRRLWRQKEFITEMEFML